MTSELTQSLSELLNKAESRTVVRCKDDRRQLAGNISGTEWDVRVTDRRKNVPYKLKSRNILGCCKDRNSVDMEDFNTLNELSPGLISNPKEVRSLLFISNMEWNKFVPYLLIPSEVEK